MYIRYVGNSSTYRFFIIKSKNNLVEVNTIMEKKIIDFFENIFLKKLSGKEQIQRTIKDKSNESFEIALKKSKRDRKETNLRDYFYTFLN